MVFAIASKRGPKVEAVGKIVPTILRFLSSDHTSPSYLPCDVNTGIAMPRSIEELLSGARGRVETLAKLLARDGTRADYLIGLEGGLHPIIVEGKESVYLQSWAYVSNGSEGFFGSSGNILVPDGIAARVMKEGRELGEVIDEAANKRDVRSNQGTWGILTRDLLTRRRSFEIALIAAFAPFYNPALYGRTAASEQQPLHNANPVGKK